MKKKTVRIVADISNELYIYLKVYLVKASASSGKRITMQQFVHEAVKEKLKAATSKPKNKITPETDPNNEMDISDIL